MSHVEQPNKGKFGGRGDLLLWRLVAAHPRRTPQELRDRMLPTICAATQPLGPRRPPTAIAHIRARMRREREAREKLRATMPAAVPSEIEAPRGPTVGEIVRAAARYYDIPVAEFIGERRHASLVIKRQVAMYLARKLTVHGWPHIGRAFGDRDHTTIIHGYRKVSRLLPNNPEVSADVSRLSALIVAATAPAAE